MANDPVERKPLNDEELKELKVASEAAWQHWRNIKRAEREALDKAWVLDEAYRLEFKYRYPSRFADAEIP